MVDGVQRPWCGRGGREKEEVAEGERGQGDASRRFVKSEL